MEKNRAGSLLLIIFLSAFVMEEVSASTPTGTVSINNNQTGFSTTNWTGDLFVGKFTNVPAGAKITAVGINVATAAGNIRVKVFDDNAGLPNNLLAESASIPVPGRGIQSISLTTSATTPSNGIVWVGFEVDSSSFVTVFKSVAVQKLWFPHTYGAGPSTASALGLATTFPNLLIYYNTSQIPLAPSTLTTSAISNSQIRLNWSTSTGATWYKIDRESPQGAGFSTIVVNTTNSTTHYDDTGLAAGTQYNYRV
ncbi:MAG: fibronectin type III domain-containing protein, partial [Thaumarchaeota archaeon]